MDTGDLDGPSATMEVDGETSTMDVNDDDGSQGQGAWPRLAGISSANDENKMTDLPAFSEPLGMAGQEVKRSEVEERVWTVPEGVCRKRVLQQGRGSCGPACGACCVVTLQIAQSACDFDVSVMGYPAGRSSVQIGEAGTLISRLIDLALMSMKADETAQVSVSGLKMKGECVFHVTLHDFTSVLPPWRLSSLEKCGSAAGHKEKGAQLFKDGNIYSAFSQFNKAIRLLLSVLPGSFDDEPVAERSHQQLLCQCYLNLAACQMKSGHHRHVITNCTQALSIEPSNVKALYRRASANINSDNLLVAQDDLEMGLRKEPNNRALLDLAHSVNSKLAQSQSRMAQGLSKMFS